MEKRLIIAVALSILIIVSFQYLVGKPTMPAPQERTRTEEVIPPAEAKGPSASLVSKTAIGPYKGEPSAAESETIVETDKYILTFSNIGGAIKGIALKEYKNDSSDEPLNLVRLSDPQEYIFATSGRINSEILSPTFSYESAKKDEEISYSFKKNNVELIKRYIFHNSQHGIELQILIKNVSDTPKTLQYDIIGAAGLTETSAQNKSFIEVRSKVNEQIINFKRPKTGRIINTGQVDWIASKNKYFSLVLKPFGATSGAFYSEERGGYYIAGVDTKEITIPPRSFVINKFMLYAGPSRMPDLNKFGFDFGETINYGFFGGIAKALIYLLSICYHLVHNWGVAVIVLSVLLNIILFPLSIKSFKSMKKMQELHPQMEKLKAQYKDNPQKLNKEIMELYKKYKINPLSGCLPLILQMPIFIALYQALSRSIELRGAGFLWIRDLSMPDAVRIPFSLPLVGNSINILPLAMVVAMVLQQKISTKTMGSAVTAEQKQQQQMMLILMPIMFGFIFYNMPSGLVLYWLINTVLTVVEQMFVFKNV